MQQVFLELFFIRPFGKDNGRAIDEPWYQRAVDQHAVEPESFVFSVPFADGPPDSNPDRILVTASHAVFVESKGHRAPAAVVGLQYLHSSIASHFLNITSKVSVPTEFGIQCNMDWFSVRHLVRKPAQVINWIAMFWITMGL